jgi:plasmid stabilization system protein ParE
MDSGYRFTPLAFEDLHAIWARISRDSIKAAVRVEAAIFDACEKLAQNPYLGQKYTTANRKAARTWVVPKFPNYKVVYAPETRPVQIVAIAHGRQNMERLLRKRLRK